MQGPTANIIPLEVGYLAKYDEFKNYSVKLYEMPDDMVSLLVRFLEQGEGELCKKALNKEFSALTKKEIVNIESKFSTRVTVQPNIC